MKRNLLLEYSEELAIKIAKLCSEYKIDSIAPQGQNPFYMLRRQKRYPVWVPLFVVDHLRTMHLVFSLTKNKVRIPAAEQRPLASRWQGEESSPEGRIPLLPAINKPQFYCKGIAVLACL